MVSLYQAELPLLQSGSRIDKIFSVSLWLRRLCGDGARRLNMNGVQRTARPTGIHPSFGLSACDVENDAETRFASHHSVVGLGGFFQGKNFVHRLHTTRYAKVQRVL